MQSKRNASVSKQPDGLQQAPDVLVIDDAGSAESDALAVANAQGLACRWHGGEVLEVNACGNLPNPAVGYAATSHVHGHDGAVRVNKAGVGCVGLYERLRPAVGGGGVGGVDDAQCGEAVGVGDWELDLAQAGAKGLVHPDGVAAANGVVFGAAHV